MIMRRFALPLVLLLLVPGLLLSACGKKTGDPAMLAYLDGIAVRAEGAARDTVVAALQDALSLPADKLAGQRYEGADGKTRDHDLRTVFQKHFEPKDMATLMKVFHKKYDFHAALKTPLVQDRLREILAGVAPK